MNPTGTRNAILTTATRTTETRNSTVSCMVIILPTTPTTVKPLSSKPRNAKRVAVATAATSAITRKGLQSKEGMGQRTLANFKECNEQGDKKRTQNFENLLVSNKESK